MNETPKPPRQTANPAPPRRVGSVRRTSSIDVSWPNGMMGNRLFQGRARDMLTPMDGGAGHVLAEASMVAELDAERVIQAISAEVQAGPAVPEALPQLIGQRGGGHLRMVIAEQMPQLLAAGAPLYLLLDDISGTSLVCSWAWSLQHPDWIEKMHRAMPDGQLQRMMQERANVCWGLAEGNSGLNPDRQSLGEQAADGGELRNPADPDGWHLFPENAGLSFRRARRIDVWRDGGLLCFEAAFQDSAPRPSGGRAGLHEYVITGSADAATLELQAIEPVGKVLPFHECPGAVGNTKRLVGTTLSDIRATVLGQLRGTAGCTHLNDALRALADVPQLVAAL